MLPGVVFFLLLLLFVLVGLLQFFVCVYVSTIDVLLFRPLPVSLRR